jgi:hypothetical protein
MTFNAIWDPFVAGDKRLKDWGIFTALNLYTVSQFYGFKEPEFFIP